MIGSGFGAAAAARPLVAAGAEVLMVERGEWVARGPAASAPEATFELTPAYSLEAPYRVRCAGREREVGAASCVGGASVFFGGVAMRLRERDFEPGLEAATGGDWPWRYGHFEAHYAEAERLLAVTGRAGDDPAGPWRSCAYPHPPAPLSPTSRLIAKAAGGLGLRPFRLPLAIDYRGEAGRPGCLECGSCDTFACAVQAKNDVATAILPRLIGDGLVLQSGLVATRLVERAGRIVGLECFDKLRQRRLELHADRFVLAAGSLGSAHLLLASGLDRVSPAGETIGRHLMRHCSSIVFGVFADLPGGPGRHHKQVGINDFYEGPDGETLGSIQQLQSPPPALVRAHLPRPLGRMLEPALRRCTGLLAMAEDAPRPENRIRLDDRRHDRFGMPRAVIEHAYTPRDLRARKRLVFEARRVLRAAGALHCHVHEIPTFSHALGTVRMGSDPAASPLDPDCAFRGLDNLHVVDGSVMPSAAGVNPSLTIAANGLRVGALLAGVDVLAEDAALKAAA